MAGRALEALAAARTAAWTDAERAALAAVIAALRPSARHLADILDWLDEVAVRDGVRPAAVLADPELRRLAGARGSAPDRLKRWKARLRCLRYPRLAAREAAIAELVRALDLGAAVAVRAAPGLEGGALTVTVRARSAAELAGALERLRARLAGGALAPLFALLDEA
jgi:hypothetical protein